MDGRTMQVRSLYLRVCRDSNYTIGAVAAAKLVGSILKISPIDVLYSMPSLSVMEEIAAGAHPATQHAALGETE